MSKTQHDNHSSEVARYNDNNRRDPATETNDAECSTTHQTLYHALTTERDTEERAESQQPSNIHLSPAMQRWEAESERQQPWLGINGSSSSPPSKGKHVPNGETGSNGAVEGTDDGKGDMSGL